LNSGGGKRKPFLEFRALAMQKEKDGGAGCEKIQSKFHRWHTSKNKPFWAKGENGKSIKRKTVEGGGGLTSNNSATKRTVAVERKKNG